jgi:hypothetical protein
MTALIQARATSRAAEIRARQDVIQTDLDALEALTESTEEDRDRADALLQEFDELTAELEPLAEREQRIATVRQKILDDRNREIGSGVAAINGTPDLVTRSNRDPFEDLESVRNGLTSPADVRARAKAAIERYAARTDHWQLDPAGAEQATRLVEKGGKLFGTAVARQMLSTGSPEYLAAFESYLQDPGGYAARAAMSLTSANGGYLVPFTLDPTIILTNAGSANPYRRVATVKTTTTNDWNGVTSAGVSAEWTAEGIEAADASPDRGPAEDHPAEGRRVPVRLLRGAVGQPTSPRSSPSCSPTPRTASRRPRSRSAPAPASRRASSRPAPPRTGVGTAATPAPPRPTSTPCRPRSRRGSAGRGRTTRGSGT